MRSKFSSQAWLKDIRHNDIDTVYSTLDFFMWDTSTAIMTSLNVPTRQDVEEWITVLSHRPDADSKTVQECIASCMEYTKITQ